LRAVVSDEQLLARLLLYFGDNKFLPGRARCSSELDGESEEQSSPFGSPFPFDVSERGVINEDLKLMREMRFGFIRGTKGVSRAVGDHADSARRNSGRAPMDGIVEHCELGHVKEEDFIGSYVMSSLVFGHP
jgi:hypothetical protein